MALEYVSTRGQAPKLGFEDATLAGLASDGGLYVPSACPKIDSTEIYNMAHQRYAEIAWRVMLPFVGDSITSGDLIKMIRKSYASFSHPEVAPLHRLEEDFFILELFHGPTLAFKDFALQFLGNLFDHILAQKKQRVTIIGATSGDTGSAAIEAFRGKENADIFILHPKGRISEVQRRQMTTVISKNVHNLAIDGSFDDCQNIVKALFNDASFRAEMQLSAVNSINWARILAQIVYYVYASARIGRETGNPVSFCVPTGNFGNVYAGYVAKSMGLNIGRFLVATNSNDILARFFETGRMQKSAVVQTISPSMDIQISSNFERLLFDLYSRDGAAVAQIMTHFSKSGPFQVDENIMGRVRTVFSAGRQDDAQTKAVMRDVYDQHGYMIDPHTAVGIGVARRLKKPQETIVSLATAHPAKFPDAVFSALGKKPELPAFLEDLISRDEKLETLPMDVARVRDFIRTRARR